LKTEKQSLREHLVKALAAARLGRLVFSAVENENWQRDKRKLLLEALVGADHLGQGLSWLSFMRDQRIFVHLLNDLWIARENLVFEM